MTDEVSGRQNGTAARLDRAVAWVRPWVRLVGLLLGCTVFGLVVFSHYDRAVTVSGRSEVIEVEADGSDFSSWEFRNATVTDAAGMPSAAGAVTIELSKAASARFVRRGRGPLLIGFIAKARGAGGCNPVGHVALADAEPTPLCEDTRIRVEPAGTPLVASLRGVVTAGEEVRAGAGAQPMLLDGSAQLLVRHGGGLFRSICKWLPTLCERFAATRADFSLGDSISFHRENGEAEATGFFRLDPADLAGGLRFDLAAADAELEVRRMKGDKFELSESPFDRIAKSPVLQALNVTLLALGLVWWFVRAPGDARTGGGGTMMAALVTALLLTSPAQAQQALLKAGETGQAILRSRADRCYAVTPAHVMGAESAASLTLERRLKADAELRSRVPAAPEAMAFLLTRAVPLELCPAFTTVPALDGLLRARASAVLRLVREDGSFDRVPLTVLSVGIETFEVQPQDPGQTLSQGMSGGTVLVDDQAAGLLTDVRDEGHVGRAARLDRVLERLLPYLGSSLAAPDAVPMQAGGSGEAAGLTVVRWTAEPVALTNRADQLLIESDKPWRVAERVASVVFGLAPDHAVLTGVVIDAGGLPDPPRAVEVLLGSSERGPWRSVASFALEPGDTIRRQAIAPSHAAFAMVRASGHQSGQATMGLGRFGMETRPR